MYVELVPWPFDISDLLNCQQTSQQQEINKWERKGNGCVYVSCEYQFMVPSQQHHVCPGFYSVKNLVSFSLLSNSYNFAFCFVWCVGFDLSHQTKTIAG